MELQLLLISVFILNHLHPIAIRGPKATSPIYSKDTLRSVTQTSASSLLVDPFFASPLLCRWLQWMKDAAQNNHRRSEELGRQHHPKPPHTHQLVQVAKLTTSLQLSVHNLVVDETHTNYLQTQQAVSSLPLILLQLDESSSQQSRVDTHTYS